MPLRQLPRLERFVLPLLLLLAQGFQLPGRAARLQVVALALALEAVLVQDAQEFQHLGVGGLARRRVACLVDQADKLVERDRTAAVGVHVAQQLRRVGRVPPKFLHNRFHLGGADGAAAVSVKLVKDGSQRRQLLIRRRAAVAPWAARWRPRLPKVLLRLRHGCCGPRRGRPAACRLHPRCRLLARARCRAAPARASAGAAAPASDNRPVRRRSPLLSSPA
mmetsp:Transcript_11235/g.39116  ORF Transcript_11235/g.39116 Transcript_11235/m.39116 type:complete len:221 (-) Transcript_11235:17-679(-)